MKDGLKKVLKCLSMKISARKAFDVTNIFLLLEKRAAILSLPSYLTISVRS